MPTYIALIRDQKGKARSEKFTANSLTEARLNLRNQGFVIQNIKESQSLVSRFDIKLEAWVYYPNSVLILK
jgi:type IV pilus assembly protein PilC